MSESDSLGRYVTRATLVLALFAVAATALVVGTFDVTKERVAANEREAMLRELYALVPKARIDNDLYRDAIVVTNEKYLGTAEPVKIYRARKQGAPVAAILAVVAPDGYSGPIHLLVAIAQDGAVLGVRVVAHKETPGLGDKIDERRTPWVHGFDGKSLNSPEPERGWAVKRDGGVFDQFSGATITPRAVVKAVKNALLFFDAHREQIFSQAENTEMPS